MMRCVQQSRHLRFQTSSITARSVANSKSTALKNSHQSAWHVLLYPSAEPCSAVALQPPPNLSSTLQLLQQSPAFRPVATTLGLQKGGEAANLRFRSHRGSGAFSVKGGCRSRGGGSADPDLFEEWLKANPLPYVEFKKGKQSGNAAPAMDAFNEDGQGFRAYNETGEECGEYESSTAEKRGREPGHDDLSMRNDTDEEQGGLLRGTSVGSNGILVRGKEECTSMEEVKSSVYSMGDFSQGRTGGGGLSWTGRGPLQSRTFSWQETGDVLYECLCECDEMMWDSEHRRFLEVIPPQGQVRMEFIPPLIQLPSSPCCAPSEYLRSLQQRRARQGNKQLLALLSSNAAALGIFKNGTLLLHKAMTAYTVRAKQGQSQLKYLRQGGPGRMTVGGAIRAREVHRFFSRVCGKLNEWGSEIEDCEDLFFSGTTRVWNELYGEDDPEMPVSRNNSRWCKVPFSVHDPCFREIQRVFYRLSHGAVNYTSVNEQQPPP